MPEHTADFDALVRGPLRELEALEQMERTRLIIMGWQGLTSVTPSEVDQP